jgi:hypothetical protein
MHPALSRALATAHIEDLHRAAAQRHKIRLARSVKHEPETPAVSRVPILSGRRSRLPVHASGPWDVDHT